MKFTLEIELGNSAMRTPEDVGRALEAMSGNVYDLNAFILGDGGKIRDTNGNTVGSWEVSE